MPDAPSPASGSEAAAAADFSGIRYAQCWEDADVLLEALDIRAGDTCFSVGSGGDNTLSMLACAPARLVAVDLSPAQIAVIDLKAGAFRALSHAQALELVGIAPSDRRVALYETVRAGLAEPSRRFWDARLALIESGLSDAGRFERYLGLMRRWLLPLIHGRRELDALFVPRSAAERRRFYAERWNNRRWRLLLRLFVSRFVMGRLGRDPSFFRYVEQRVAPAILPRVEHALADLDPAANPYLQWIAYGRFPGPLPHAWRRENFEAIRAHVDRLELVVAPVEDCLRAAPERQFDRFNLSDIFEYVSPAASERLFDDIVRCARPGARVAYWNMMVPRACPPRLVPRLQPQPALGEQLHRQAKAFFYGALHVDQRTDLP